MEAKSPRNKLDPIIAAAAEEAKTRDTFFSFGDEGLTASVSARGRLLRITQHFPGQKAGFCVDPTIMPEPYCTTQRIEWFLFLAQWDGPAIGGAVGGIGPSPESLCPEPISSPKHEIINDRWPAFSQSSQSKKSKSRVEYVASAGTIYQKFEFFYIGGHEEDRNGLEQAVFAGISLHPDLLIRDLDFVDKNNEFNKPPPSDSQPVRPSAYTTRLSDSHKSITRTHKLGDRDIVLHINVLNKDGSLEFFKHDKPTVVGEHRKSSDAGRYHIRRDVSNSQSILEDHGEGSVIRFVLAYTLAQSSTPFSSLPTWKTFCDADNLLQPRKDDNFHLCQDPILDFFLKRNLEYILSVCSVPIADTDEPEDSIPAVALTCGDVEGHRVATAASLIACPNYWTDGQEIQGWESNEWLPKRSLVDVPFQLIKAGDLFKRLGTLPEDVFDAAHEAFKTLIHDLEAIDKLDFSAFPSHAHQSASAPTETFYFTDHALIWRAVKSAESMGFELPYGMNGRQKYSANALRKNIIKRFTTEHPVLKKRMIATRRTPTRTRFLVRSKDTFLFRAMEEGLFDNVNLWNHTMDCQKYHDGNDDTKWEDPRRFAISIAMTRQNSCINLRPGREMLQHAMTALLKSSSSNGLFAGRIDETLSPILYDHERMRDDYWAVVFEVPYLLWKYYCSDTIKDEPTRDPKPDLEPINDRPDSICHSIEHIKQLLGDVVTQQAHPEGQHNRRGYRIKHDLPFNNMIAEENIVDLKDEWLYSSPSFFTNGMEDNIASSSCQILPDNARDEARDGRSLTPYSGFVVDVPDQKSLRKEEATDDLRLQRFPVPTRVAEIMGKARTVKDAKKRLWAFAARNASWNKELMDTVLQKELRENAAVKRFFRGHECYDNFFTEETEPLLNLWTTEFHMHFRRLLVRSDECSIQKVAMGFRFEGDFFDRYWTCRYVEADPRISSENDIVQSMIKLLEPKDLTVDVMSSREGSIDQRLKVGPWRQRRVLELMLFRTIIKRMNEGAKEVFESANITLDFENKQLRKRLGRLDKQREKKTWRVPGVEILSPSHPRADAGENETAQGSPIDYRSFVMTSRQLHDIQSNLQAVGADFLENRAAINLWLGREEDRRAERPRWTLNHENRYRAIISKLIVKNNRSIQDLERKHSMIAGLSESITKELELVRSHLEMMLNDKEQRRAEDIALFTYVTAIFLPLGFATGLFSMSGAPDRQTAGAMAGTAVGVLLLGALIFLAVTKRVTFGKRPGFPSSASQISPSLKANTGNGSTSEGEQALNGKIASRAVKTTGLPRSYSAAGALDFRTRRRNNGDLEAGGGTPDPADLVGENMRTQSYGK